MSSRFVRPQAPTAVVRRPTAPHSPSISPRLRPEILTVLRLQVDLVVCPSSTLGGDLDVVEMGAGASRQKWPIGIKDVPRVSGTHRETICPCDTGDVFNPRVALAASMRPCARTAASLGLLAALGYPSICHPATQCLEHSLLNSTHPLFLFLDLPIAPWFAFCAQPGVDFCGV